MSYLGFPCGSAGKESACNAGDPGVQFLGREDPLEKGSATHSSILAWRIPWTIQSTGTQRVIYHLFTKLDCEYFKVRTSVIFEHS